MERTALVFTHSSGNYSLHANSCLDTGRPGVIHSSYFLRLSLIPSITLLLYHMLSSFCDGLVGPKLLSSYRRLAES